MPDTQSLARQPDYTIDHAKPATAVEVRAQVNLIQEVLRGVMKNDTHYGTIPGTQRPTLYKAGAEKILMTFRIAAAMKQVDDLSTADAIRYRVTIQGVGQASGIILGEGVGECSSDEEKYKWRRPVHQNEYDAAPNDRKREKWTRDGKVWQQVRVDPADVANTVLKMASKRALVAMTLVVTAASDVFVQDLEDLPEEVRESVVEGEAQTAAIQPPQRKASEPKTHPSNGGSKISEPQRKRFYAIAKGAGWHDDELKRWLFAGYGLEHTGDIPVADYDAIVKAVQEEAKS